MNARGSQVELHYLPNDVWLNLTRALSESGASSMSEMVAEMVPIYLQAKGIDVAGQSSAGAPFVPQVTEAISIAQTIPFDATVAQAADPEGARKLRRKGMPDAKVHWYQIDQKPRQPSLSWLELTRSILSVCAATDPDHAKQRILAALPDQAWENGTGKTNSCVTNQKLGLNIRTPNKLACWRRVYSLANEFKFQVRAAVLINGKEEIFDTRQALYDF